MPTGKVSRTRPACDRVRQRRVSIHTESLELLSSIRLNQVYEAKNRKEARRGSEWRRRRGEEPCLLAVGTGLYEIDAIGCSGCYVIVTNEISCQHTPHGVVERCKRDMSNDYALRYKSIISPARR